MSSITENLLSYTPQRILKEIDKLKQHYYGKCYDAFQKATNSKELVECLMLVNGIHPISIYTTDSVSYRHIATCLPDDVADKCIPAHLTEVVNGHRHFNFEMHSSVQTYKLILDNMHSCYLEKGDQDDYTLDMLLHDVSTEV